MRLKLFLAAVLPLAFTPSPGTAAETFAPPFDSCSADHLVDSALVFTGYSHASCDAPGTFVGEGEIAGPLGGLAPSGGAHAEAQDRFTITRTAQEAADIRVYLVTIRLHSARVAAHAPHITGGSAQISLAAQASLDGCECIATDSALVVASGGPTIIGSSSRVNNRAYTLTLFLQNIDPSQPLPPGDVVISVAALGTADIPIGGLGSYDFSFTGSVTSLIEV